MATIERLIRNHNTQAERYAEQTRNGNGNADTETNESFHRGVVSGLYLAEKIQAQEKKTKKPVTVNIEYTFEAVDRRNGKLITYQKTYKTERDNYQMDFIFYRTEVLDAQRLGYENVVLTNKREVNN